VDVGEDVAAQGLDMVRHRIEEAVDAVKTRGEEVDVVLVGGGSVVVGGGLRDVRSIQRPRHLEVLLLFLLFYMASKDWFSPAA
jgi:hypothetical protein